MCKDILVLCFIFSAAEASVKNVKGQQLYCALSVKVVNSSGLPSKGIPVALIRDKKFTYAETTTDSEGYAKLCDAPIEPVDLFVGVDMCGSVLVQRLKFIWPEERFIAVAYEKSFCPHMAVAPNCQLLFRVHDDKGRPVIGARFEGPATGQGGSVLSDSFGRLFRLVKKGEKLEGRVLKESGASEEISWRCTEDSEKQVLLNQR